ncbi:MAG: hypothetical protein K2X94_01500 [Amoebophilaceae bacterium]|nr:hypothetical protein [Amoebophilaceae bacterium]
MNYALSLLFFSLGCTSASLNVEEDVLADKEQVQPLSSLDRLEKVLFKRTYRWGMKRYAT